MAFADGAGLWHPGVRAPLPELDHAPLQRLVQRPHRRPPEPPRGASWEGVGAGGGPSALLPGRDDHDSGARRQGGGAGQADDHDHGSAALEADPRGVRRREVGERKLHHHGAGGARAAPALGGPVVPRVAVGGDRCVGRRGRGG
uniref:DUF834 domain-containing protein n=1 Tax=Setaria viridis TaxID=4556 RepID=A0A4U6STQ6_SETVI|nr:hypothetical protein SEVIR_9G136501v2 [Setaria viridis]